MQKKKNKKTWKGKVVHLRVATFLFFSRFVFFLFFPLSKRLKMGFDLSEFLKLCNASCVSKKQHYEDFLNYLSEHGEEPSLFTERVSCEYTINEARGAMYTQPAIFNMGGYTPLHFAVAGETKHVRVIEEILKRLSDEDIWVKTKPKRDKKKNEDEKKDEKEEGGWTALHFASYYFGRFSSGDEDAMVDVVDAILCRCSGSHGIPWALSLKTPEGFTPLFLACMSRNTKLITKYLSLGADPLVQDNNGNNCIHALMGWGQNYDVQDIGSMVKVFQSAGIDINKGNNKGKPPLFYAAYQNCDFFFELVELGADLGVVDKKGRNLFHIMAKRNSFIHTDKLIGEVTKYLKEKGEEEKIDVNKFDKDGRNPLMHLWYSDANGSQFLKQPEENIVNAHHLFVSFGASLTISAPPPSTPSEGFYPLSIPLLYQLLNCHFVDVSEKQESEKEEPQWKFLWEELTKSKEFVSLVDQKGRPPCLFVFSYENGRQWVSKPVPTFKALLEKGADPLQKRVVEKKEEKEEKKEEKDTKKGKEKEKKEEDPEEMEIVNKIEGTSIRALLNWGLSRDTRKEDLMVGLASLVSHGALTDREVKVLLNREKRLEEERKKANEPSTLDAIIGVSAACAGLLALGLALNGVAWACSSIWALILSLFS